MRIDHHENAHIPKCLKTRKARLQTLHSGNLCTLTTWNILQKRIDHHENANIPKTPKNQESTTTNSTFR